MLNVLLILLLLLCPSVSTAGAWGATFVSDSFTDTDTTDLTAHTGETGATWSKVTGVIKIMSNRAKGDSGVESAYVASGSPATAEYDVQGNITEITTVDHVGLIARAQVGATTYYRAYYDNSASQYAIDKVVTGTVTNLGTYATSSTGTVTIKFEVRDATKKLFVGGVERISTNDNAITGAGKAGLYYNNSDWGFGSTGRPMDHFTATDAGETARPK